MTDDRNHLVALAGLPHVGPSRLRTLHSLGDPKAAWRALGSGALDGPLGLRRAESAAIVRAVRAAEPAAIGARHDEAGVRIDVLGEPSYPTALAGDHAAPVVLFSAGDIGALDRVGVAVVGTRRASGYGRDVAFTLGRDLTAHGVAVISGLAVGIDAAAHAGAVAEHRTATSAPRAQPVAVLGCGLDIGYPRANRRLRSAVEEIGLVVAEVPLGTAPAPWRFPARNRIIAAMARAVVVVESGFGGGSMLTVDEAIERSLPVLAVPGPVRSAASFGANELLAQGCAPCRDHEDVLVAIGLDSRRAEQCRAGSGSAVDGASEAGLDPAAARVLDAMGWSPTSLDRLAGLTDMTFAELCEVLERLVAAGRVRDRGGRYERTVTGR